MLPAPLSPDEWRQNGRTFPHHGYEVFYRDSGNASRPALLLIHGFPTASWDFYRIWDALAERYRVLAPDLLGFGFSAKPRDYHYSLLDQAETSAAWPPYDIEKVSEDAYRITMAVAGFAQDEIELTQHDTTLLVTGQKKAQEGERQYLHRGIAGRTFRQSFNLAQHVRVTGASLDNGLLTVELKREVPEAFKPRRIAIGGTGTAIGQDNASVQKAPAQVEDLSKAA